MPGRSCSSCTRSFSSSSNRIRHERLFHKPSDEKETVEDYPENNSESDEDPSDEEMKDEEKQDEERESRDMWRDIVLHACLEFKNELLTRADQVLLEPFLSEFVEHMKEYVEEKFQFVKSMEQDDQYEKINCMIDQLDGEEYDREEAVDCAWHNRRFLVKRMIQENIDLVAKIVDRDHSDDD